MDADRLVEKWVLTKLGENWRNPEGHVAKFGCELSASNVHFGIASGGYCESCYHEYEAVIFDLTCSCPDKVPTKGDPRKLKKNGEKINIKNFDIPGYGDFELTSILKEMLELDDREV